MSQQTKKEDQKTLSKEEETTIQQFIQFLNDSPSPYHAVDTISRLLKQNNFKKLEEKDDWSTLSPGNYYFTRNQSTIVAICVPPKWKPGNGFTITGAHTDSPNFRVKPISKQTNEGYLQIGVEAYGGGLWHTWFDRDLSIAGRVIVKNYDEEKQNNNAESRLVRIDKPILRISNLAIHLNRDITTNGFKPNNETETVPIFATEACCQLNQNMCTESKSPLNSDHHPLLLNLLAKHLNVSSNDIFDFELSLYDTQPACIGGALDEFIYSARLDNLCSCFICLHALINYMSTLKDETNIRMLMCFDNEEIGSNSNRGADSNLIHSTMLRIHGQQYFESAIAKSIILSNDMAHALHPNYSDKHEKKHRPKIHQGLVIKYNSNQRYASNMESTYHILSLSQKLSIPVQKFMVRNDSPCGTTIGPILATKCGIRTVDVGVPQLSMHSVREVCGVKDVCSSLRLITEIYNQFVKLDSAFKLINN